MSITHVQEKVSLENNFGKESSNTSASEIEANIETITPEEAKELLADMDVNRVIKEAQVAKLFRAMGQGRWTVLQPLVIGSHGRLLDGQHRLIAQIKYGKPLPYLVMRGVSPEDGVHLDHGVPRSANDILAMIGVRNSALVAALSRILLSFEEGQLVWPSSKFSKLNTEEIVDRALAEKKPLSRIATLSCGKYKPASRMLGSTAQLGFYLYLLERNVGEEGMVDDFFETFSGTNGVVDPVNPAVALRTKLVANMSNTSKKFTQEAKCAFFVKAWNAYYRDAPMKTIVYRKFGFNAEKFPKILGSAGPLSPGDEYAFTAIN